MPEENGKRGGDAGGAEEQGEPPSTERYARIPHLWALGVGAVISGDFFGWQSGLAAGVGGLAVCLTAVTILYVTLAFSVAELSTALPSAGGPYTFALRSMGPGPAFFTGLAESLKCIVTVAVIVVGIGSYLNEIIGAEGDALRYSPLWWLLFYAIFVALNIYGVAASFMFQLAVTILSIVELVVFYVGAATVADYPYWVLGVGCTSTCGNASDIAAPGAVPSVVGNTTAFPLCTIENSCPEPWLFASHIPGETLMGLIKGLSFSLWFYLGIEELPLAAEETINPEKNMKWGIISAMFTLVVLAYLTMFFNSIVAPGAKAMWKTTSPLLIGYRAVFGDNAVTTGFSWILTVGLITSFHSFIFCTGRLLFAIARDGFFPRMLGRLHSTRRTPWVAIIVGSAIGYVIAVLLFLATNIDVLGSVLINLALIGALISYILQLISFVVLRHNQKYLSRPYRSPFGIAGALIALVLSLVVMAAIVYTGADNLDLLYSVIGAAVYFVIGGAYYVFYARKHVKLHKDNGFDQHHPSPPVVDEMPKTDLTSTRL